MNHPLPVVMAGCPSTSSWLQCWLRRRSGIEPSGGWYWGTRWRQIHCWQIPAWMVEVYPRQSFLVISFFFPNHWEHMFYQILSCVFFCCIRLFFSRTGPSDHWYLPDPARFRLFGCHRRWSLATAHALVPWSDRPLGSNMGHWSINGGFDGTIIDRWMDRWMDR